MAARSPALPPRPTARRPPSPAPATKITTTAGDASSRYKDYLKNGFFVICTKCNAKPVVSHARVRPRCQVCKSECVEVPEGVEPSNWEELRGDTPLKALCYNCDKNSPLEYYARCGGIVSADVKARYPERFEDNRDVCRNGDVVFGDFFFDNTAKKPCAICAKPQDVMLHFPNPCNHVVCPDCFAGAWKQRISERRIPWDTQNSKHGITCPVGCQVFVDVHLLKLLGEEQYEKYKDVLITKNFLEKTGHYGVYCAVPKCSEFPFIPANLDGTFAQCPKCKRHTCVICQEQAANCQCQGVDPALLNRYRVEVTDHFCHRVIIPDRERDLLVRVQGSQNFILKYHKDDTPTILKCIIERDHNIPCYLQKIVFAGFEMPPNEPLSKYNLSNSTTLQIIQIAAIEEPVMRTQTNNKAGVMIGKPCPRCGTRVVHNRNHGCHHITPGTGCTGCAYHFCYVCLGPFPCINGCKLFCSKDCDCSPCDECKPGYPCRLCSGCEKCSI